MEYLHCTRIQVLLVAQVVSTFELLFFLAQNSKMKPFVLIHLHFGVINAANRSTRMLNKALRFLFSRIASSGWLPGQVPLLCCVRNHCVQGQLSLLCFCCLPDRQLPLHFSLFQWCSTRIINAFKLYCFLYSVSKV